MNSCMFSFGFQLIFIRTSKSWFSSSNIIDFHKVISIDNSESDEVLKTFIFMNTVMILYILRVYFVADRMQICLVLSRGKTCVHTSSAIV